MKKLSKIHLEFLLGYTKIYKSVDYDILKCIKTKYYKAITEETDEEFFNCIRNLRYTIPTIRKVT